MSTSEEFVVRQIFMLCLNCSFCLFIDRGNKKWVPFAPKSFLYQNNVFVLKSASLSLKHNKTALDKYPRKRTNIWAEWMWKKKKKNKLREVWIISRKQYSVVSVLQFLDDLKNIAHPRSYKASIQVQTSKKIIRKKKLKESVSYQRRRDSA